MNLKDQVVSRELAEKLLLDAEIQEDSLFVWSFFEYGTHEEWKIVPTSERTDSYYPAYTVAELGEMLPIRVDTNKTGKKTQKNPMGMTKDWNIDNIYILQFYPTTSDVNKWGVQYRNTEHKTITYAYAPTEADARAKMLIELKEKGLPLN